MESQTIEWKETWRDEYMRTICAFANTSGGTLEIGRRDDGTVVGVADVNKLLEENLRLTDGEYMTRAALLLFHQDPENWSVQDLFETHRSEPHNPMIANAFFRAGMIESWGRGIEKITNSCKSAGKSEPIFEFKRNCEFSVTFYTLNIAKDTIKDTVNGVQGKMLALLSENPRMTAKKISLELGINERNVKKNIKTLKEAGLVKRVGAAKGGYWEVKK